LSQQVYSYIIFAERKRAKANPERMNLKPVNAYFECLIVNVELGKGTTAIKS